MNILITLCARGGSVGIPGKNIKLLHGKPLIAYSIQTAQRFADMIRADIALSTDDDAIKKTAAAFGLSTEYERPVELATGTAGKIDTISHLLQFEEQSRKKAYDIILDLDVTSPLRTVTDLQSAFELLLKDDNALNIFSVSPAQKSPYFNMVESKTNGYFGLVKRHEGTFLTRQSAPAVYEMNASFYFYRKQFFRSGQKSAITERSLVYVMPHVCFDLDHPLDFEFLNFLMANDRLGFAL